MRTPKSFQNGQIWPILVFTLLCWSFAHRAQAQLPYDGWHMPNNTEADITSLVALGGSDFEVTVLYATQGLNVLKSVDGGKNWTVLTTGITTTRYDVASYNSNLWAVGNDNKIYRSTNAGSSWTSATATGATTLFGVSFFSSTGWAVGTGGVIFKSTDNGSTWTAQTSNTTQTLLAIEALSATIAVAVGNNGTICRTTNGGTTWTVTTNGTNQFTDVEFEGSVGYVVGSSGRIIKSTNDGAIWANQTSGTTNGLQAVAYNGFTAWAAGSSGTILKTTDGTNWVATPTGRTDVFYAIANRYNSITQDAAFQAWAASADAFLHTASGGIGCQMASVNIVSPNTTVCSGANVVLEVANTGTVGQRIWKRNGTAISIAGNMTAHPTQLDLGAVDINDAGTYTVDIISTCNTVTSSSITLTVNTIPTQPSAITGDNLPTQTIPYDYSVTNVPGTTYSWSGGTGSSVSGSGNSVNITWTAVTGAKTVTVTPSNGCGTGTAQTLPVTVLTPIVPNTYLPAENATGVGVTDNLSIKFAGDILLRSGTSLTIKRTADNSTFETYTISSGNVTVSDLGTEDLIIINPTNSFENNTGYYVLIDPEFAYASPGGNDYVGISSTTGWNFTTVAAADVTPPTTLTFSPVDNATNVTITSNLVATFSENVLAVSSKVVSIRRTSDNAVFESYTLPNPNVAISGATVTINPSATMLSSTGYYVNMDAGAFEDAAGNDFAGITNNSTWNFTTAAPIDGTPPSVSTLSPLDNATDVAITSNLAVTFSENVFAVATKVVSIRRTSDNSVFESYTLPNASVTISGSTVTINAASNLVNSVSYYVNIEAGAFEDAAGNDFAGITTNSIWNFTTVAAGDTTPPSLISIFPIDGATNVAGNATFLMTFNESVFIDDGTTFRFRRVSNNSADIIITTPNAAVTVSGATITIDPPTNFTLNYTEYWVEVVSAIRDANNNYFAGISNNTTWNFTTGDVNFPTYNSMVPNDDATGISLAHSPTLYFTENVFAVASKTVSIRRTSDNSVFVSYTLPHASVSINNSVVSIAHTASYDYSTGYYIMIDAGAFEDAAGNDFTGITNNTTWNFTTMAAPADVTPPTIASLNPVNTAANLPIDANLVAIFSENITAVNGKVIAVKRTSDNAVFESYTLPHANVGVGANSITINPTGTFLNATGYYVTMDAGTVQDAAGNPFAGISNSAAWSYTTVAAAPQNQTITFNALVTKTFGDAAFALTATASSGLPVSYGSSNTSVATISGSTVTIVGAGSTTITASQAGNGSFNPAPDVQQTLTVNKANQTITFGTLAAKTFGDANFTLGATASSGLGVTYNSSNTAVATVGGNTVTIIGAGSTTITASQAGNANFNAATNVQQTLTVNKASQTITFDALATKTIGDPAFGLTATTSSGLAVSYSSSNTTVATVSGSTVTIVGVGSTTITASQTGNANYNAAVSVQQNLTVNSNDNTPPAVVSFSPANNATGIPLSTTFSITFSENIKLAANGTGKVLVIRTIEENFAELIFLDNSHISGNVLSVNYSNLSAGRTYYIKLEDGVIADLNNNTFSGFTVNNVWRFSTIKEDQTISFGTLTAKTFGEAAFDLTATASSGLAVTYASSNTSVATVSGNTVSILGVGSTTITASQAGNANFNAATNVQQTLTVNKANQTITFGSLAAKTFGDANFNLGATTSSGLSVSYGSSNTSVATVSGNTVTIVGAGSATITASQAGNATYHPATNVQQTLTVNKANQTITFSALAAKTFGDANFNLGSTASSGLSVSYSSSNTSVATVSGNTVTIVGAGSTTITALQAGNGNFNAATNVQQTLTVNKANQTITFGTLTAKTFGDANFNLGATASSGLSVSYSSSNTSVATVSGNTVTVVGAGSTTITASQAGNGNFNAAANVQQTLTVNKANQTITFSDIPGKTLGDTAFGLTASASSGLAVSFSSSNTAVATVSGSTVTIVGAGSTVITASQVGNANYSAALDMNKTLVVTDPAKQNQTITFGALAAKTFGDANFNLSATASSGLAVVFSSSNAAIASVSGTVVTIHGAGTVTITANQSGNGTFNAAPPVEQTLIIGKANQTITFGVLAAKTFGDADFNVLATSTSGLAVSFTSSNTAVASVSGSTITIVGAGTATITAVQGGDVNYNAASSVGRTLTVNKADQIITFGSLAAVMVSDPPFTLSASASSGLAVSYVSSNTAVATVSGNTVTIVGEGSTIITASQSGNTNYNSAPAVPQTLTVNNKLSQTITFAALSAKTFGDANFSLMATASSNLAVSYTSSNTAVATVSGNTVTIVGAGTTSITASQAGNETFNAASAVQQTLTVNKASQTITFGALAQKIVGDAAFALSATSSSSLTVTFSSSNASVATISGNTVTLVGAGSTTITASQSGNSNFLTATAVQQVLVVNAQTRIISLSGNMAFGELIVPETATRVLTIVNSGNTTLTINNIAYPAGVNGDKTSGSVVAGGSLTVNVSLTANEAKEFSGNIAVTSDATAGAATIAVSGTANLVTGLEPNLVSRLKVYPNPGVEVFTIEVYKPTEETIHVADQTGKFTIPVKLEFLEEGKYAFKMTEQPQGVYFLRIQTESGIKTARIIKL